jgi:hypothetical protein
MFGRRNRFNTNPDVRRVRRIGSAWNRMAARSNGRNDGKIQIYGPDTSAPEFRAQCVWLHKQQERAAEIQSHSNRNIAEWIRQCANYHDQAIKELEILDAKIAALVSDSATTHCKLPTTSHRSSILFLLFMFLFEFFFSAVSLSTSGIGALGFELAIAVIAAAALVWLSEIVGRSIRQLPLSPDAEPADRWRHAIQIVLCCISLALILLGVNFLRSITATADSGTIEGTANQIVHWALFAVGLGLVLAGIFKSSDDEYSGPRFGLAKLQRRRQFVQRQIAYYDSTGRRLTEFPAHLQLIADSTIQRLFSLYADQYRRSSHKIARESQRAT